MPISLFPVLPPIREREPIANPAYFLTANRIEYIASLLKGYVLDHKPFLHKGYFIRDLAADIKIPAYQLSAYLNQQLGMNFNDYFNWFRVKHCQELMQRGLVGTLNLRGLANRCGFNNRNTLATAFKKLTGLTPSGYTRCVMKGNPGIFVLWEGIIIDSSNQEICK